MGNLKAQLKYEKNYWQRLLSKKGNHKIFCISMQKNGTTSVGDFLEKVGFPTARWRHANNSPRYAPWTDLWYKGDFEAIFNSRHFKSFQAYEDDPWWLPEFYKVLAHRFPKAKFILVTRDEEQWFKSMLNHNNGMSLGNPRIHAKAYRRETEFRKEYGFDHGYNVETKTYENLLPLAGMKKHYLDVYNSHNQEVIQFFKETAAERLIHLKLEDETKWQKLGKFLGVPVEQAMSIHSNKTFN